MAYNRLKDNVNVINYAIANNRMALKSVVNEEDVPMLAEDLSNLVDVGTMVSNLDADQLKSFSKDICMGIAKTDYIDRIYKADTFGIVKNNVDYNGAYQRLCIKNIQPVLESHAQKLVSGTNYFDGKYYGEEIDAKIFSDAFNFKIPYSIGYEDIRSKFVDRNYVMTTIDQWRNAIETSLEVKLKGVADDLILKLIVDAKANNRVVKLITTFNTYFGYTEDNAKTFTDIKQNETLMKQFVGFVSMCIGLVRGGMNKLNKKYNDTTVPTFTPSDKINIIGLSEFMTMLNNFGYANIYNENLIEKANVYNTVSWQSDGQSILPLMSTSDENGITDVIKNGTFVVEDGSITSEDATSTSKVVMAMYDADMVGVTSHLNKIGVEEIGAELYTTYFHHFSLTQYLDERGASVVFTLD